AVKNTDSNGRMRSVLNVYYNGEGSPTISQTLEQLAGAVYLDTLSGAVLWTDPYISASFDGTSNTSFAFRMPFPYTGGIKVDLVNGSSTTASTIWYVVVNHTGVTNDWPKTRRLRVGSYSSGAGGCTINSTVNFLNATSTNPGRYLGLWWQEDGSPNTVVPRSAPM